jgi:hypothetical protein
MNSARHLLRVRRRQLLLSGAALAAAPAAWAHGAAVHLPPPLVGEGDAQAQLEHARRVFAALARLGEPLAPAALEAIQKLADAGQLANAANAALRLLQTRVLAVLAVTPEARVSAQRALPRAALVQTGWRLFLLRIDNPAAVPGRLNVSSPNAVAVHGIAPPKPVAGGSMGNVGQTTTRGDMAERWLDLELHDNAPLDAALEPVRADYKLLALYARDAGRRSASSL